MIEYLDTTFAVHTTKDGLSLCVGVKGEHVGRIAVLRAEHLGPGDHPSGSPQAVHAGDHDLPDYEDPRTVRGEAWEKLVREEFGLTNDVMEAGYVLPNGDWLDLSGKSEGGQPGLRSLDHRSVGRVVELPPMPSTRPGGPNPVATATQAMKAFVRESGAMRLHTSRSTSFVGIGAPLTQSQGEFLRSRAEVIWDVYSRDGAVVMSGEMHGPQDFRIVRTAAAKMAGQDYDNQSQIDRAQRLYFGELERAEHKGPGEHPSGSPQKVHGRRGGEEKYEKIKADHGEEAADKWAETGEEPEGSEPSAEEQPKRETYNPDITLDADGDGVTDFARVGVPANSTPPPPPIPVVPNLPPEELAEAERWASEYEADPDAMADQYRDMLESGELGDGPNVFATDSFKDLNPAYTKSLESRAKFNTAVHNVANAGAKRAFERELEETLPYLPPEDREILVTAGGVASGKGFALQNNPAIGSMADSAAAVWDSAGEQYATELPWVTALARKYKARVTAVYVHADPEVSWGDKNFGAVKRAQKKGRLPAARLFSESYPLSQQNFEHWRENNLNKADVRSVVINNIGGASSVIDHAPPQKPAETLYQAARAFLEGASPDFVPDWAKAAGLQELWAK